MPYIATPPVAHFDYTLKALAANKHVYLEKPMAMTVDEAYKICKAVARSEGKLTVAHYRRKLSAFKKVKTILDDNAIGKVLFADIQILQPKNSDIVAKTEENWRLNPSVSGGGYFYDLAPHQIDLMYHYFEAFDHIFGYATGNKDLV